MSQSIYLINYQNEENKLIDDKSETIKFFPVSEHILIEVIKKYCEPKELFESNDESTGIVVLKNNELPELLSELKELFVNTAQSIQDKNIDNYIYKLTMIGNIIGLIELKESKFKENENILLSVG
ncbi:hypothetical protein [Pasteurella multocida]|uniref:hypothetical protein n=1 Tax=Pasteurella multocida TaxID=747 RepID=UPI0028DD943F|nr:hypothetical protein [Pasteurella multocida]